MQRGLFAILLFLFGFQPALATFTTMQKRCLYAQLPLGCGKKLHFTFVSCPYGVVMEVPRDVRQRIIDGVPTIRIQCIDNDCYLTRDITRKYAEMHGILPPWNGQVR